MRVELRPDPMADNRPNTLPVLDEAVIEGACSVHAEMMSDTGLHIAIQGADEHWVSLYVSIHRVRGRQVLQLRGEE
jgi:hypothetical protein